MKAETAYNVINALPEEERKRLYAMLQLEYKEVKKPKRKSNVMSPQEFYEAALAVMTAKQIKRNGYQLKAV